MKFITLMVLFSLKAIAYDSKSCEIIKSDKGTFAIKMDNDISDQDNLFIKVKELLISYREKGLCNIPKKLPVCSITENDTGSTEYDISDMSSTKAPGYDLRVGNDIVHENLSELQAEWKIMNYRMDSICL